MVNGDAANEDEACKDEFELMSIDKIINGKVRFAQPEFMIFCILIGLGVQPLLLLRVTQVTNILPSAMNGYLVVQLYT